MTISSNINAIIMIISLLHLSFERDINKEDKYNEYIQIELNLTHADISHNEIPSLPSTDIPYALLNSNYIHNFIDKTAGINILHLKKKDNSHQMMLIEYSSCVDDSLIDFSIRKFFDVNNVPQDLLKNSTDIVYISKEREYGRVRIIIQLKDNDPIAFIVFSKKTVDISLSYIVKYTTAVTISSKTDIKIYNKTLDVQYNHKKEIIKLRSDSLIYTQSEANKQIKDIEFMYKVFKRNIIEPKYTSICMLTQNENGTNTRIRYQEGIIDITQDLKLENNTFGQVLVISILRDKKDYNYVAYDSFAVIIGQPELELKSEKIVALNTKPDQKLPFPLYCIILICICWTIIISVMIAFFTRKCRTTNIINEEMEDLNMYID